MTYRTFFKNHSYKILSKFNINHLFTIQFKRYTQLFVLKNDNKYDNGGKCQT